MSEGFFLRLKKELENSEILILILVLIAGLLLRWIGLDWRPFHHDESLNSIYGKYFFDNPNVGYYKYQALLHGPLLYNIEPFIYEVFGVSNWSARFLMALIGSFFIFLPLFFHRFFNLRILIILVATISLSPGLIYWSRFVREDMLMLLTMGLTILAAVQKNNKIKVLVIPWLFTLQACIKENIFVTAAILLGYLFYQLLFQLFQKKSWRTSHLGLILTTIRENYKWFLISIGLSIFTFVYLYSAGFRHMSGILDGIYRESLLYWWNQHHIERIKGPFSFKFFYISWYEPLILAATLIQTTHLYISSKKMMISGLTIVILGFITYFAFRNNLNQAWIHFFKLKIPIDLFLLIWSILHSILITTFHLKKNQPILAFFAYLSFSSFFTYSYLGEKVPWLSSYFLFPLIIYLALYINSFFDFQQKYKKCYLLLLIFFSIFNIRLALITNFSRAGSNTEFISQVHTTENFQRTMEKIKDELLYPLGKPKKVLINDDSIWPATWYFHGIDGFEFNLGKNKISDFDYIVRNSNIENEEILRDFEKRSLPLRGWWVPDYNRMSLLNYFRYMLFHIPWNPPGDFTVILYSKKNYSSSAK